MPRKPRRRTPAKPSKRPTADGIAPPLYRTLADYLATSGDTQTSLAKALRIPQPQVSRIANGIKMPRPPLARRIATYCRIPMESFSLVYLIRHGSPR